MEVLIIGGSRFVGPLLTERLLAKDNKVTIFNRGKVSDDYPAGVTFIKGDRNKGFNLIQHFDVIVDMCAYNGAQTKTALDQLSFDFFIHFGSVASYKKSEIFPLTEDSPSGDWPLMGDYNKGKVECEEVLAASGKKHASIRPAYILGPNNYMNRENFIYSRISAGQPVMLPGNGQALVEFVFAKDVADIIVLLAEKRVEGAYNCSGDEKITLKGLVEEMAKIGGKEAVISYNPKADGADHNEDEFPFANENLISSSQKIKDLGFSFTLLVQGLREDFESYYKANLS